MQSKRQGPLESYNSLNDDNLAIYFSNPRKLSHLIRMGLITKDGLILDEESIRRYHSRKEHQMKSKHLMSEELVKKAVEMEKLRRGKLNKTIQHLSKLELAEKIKHQSSYPSGVADLTPDPNSLPLLKRTFERHKGQLNLSPASHMQLTELLNEMSSTHQIKSRCISPYVPTRPRPPSAPRPQSTANMQIRARRIQSRRPQTAPVGLEDKVHTNILMSFQYLGDPVKLKETQQPKTVEVFQQHCRGNAICLFRRDILPKANFSFVSRRHFGMPLGLSLYVDGLAKCRISSCCEYKHSLGSIIGGSFELVSIEGGKPCYQCQMEPMKNKLVASTRTNIENITKIPTVAEETPCNQDDDYADDDFEKEEETAHNGEDEDKYDDDYDVDYHSDFETQSNEQPMSTEPSPFHTTTSVTSIPPMSTSIHPTIQRTHSPDEAIVSDIVTKVLSSAIKEIERECHKDTSSSSDDDSLIDDNYIREYLNGVINRAKEFVTREKENNKPAVIDRAESEMSIPEGSSSSSSSTSSTSSFNDQRVSQVESGRRSRLDRRSSDETVPSSIDEDEFKSKTNNHAITENDSHLEGQTDETDKTKLDTNDKSPPDHDTLHLQDHASISHSDVLSHQTVLNDDTYSV